MGADAGLSACIVHLTSPSVPFSKLYFARNNKWGGTGLTKTSERACVVQTTEAGRSRCQCHSEAFTDLGVGTSFSGQHTAGWCKEAWYSAWANSMRCWLLEHCWSQRDFLNVNQNFSPMPLTDFSSMSGSGSCFLTNMTLVKLLPVTHYFKVNVNIASSFLKKQWKSGVWVFLISIWILIF